MINGNKINGNFIELETMKRKLLLIVVAYHPKLKEVKQLKECMLKLRDDIGYALVINDYKSGEFVDDLISQADISLLNKDNPGYGTAVNRLFNQVKEKPEYIGVLNADLTWHQGTFEKILDWLINNKSVVLAVPRIIDNQGIVQKLCKRNPTFLSLFSRRFLIDSIKPKWLQRYDQHYVMSDFDYNKIFEVPYLSGCCMLINSKVFEKIGGFDEQFFLYLEDADISRRLSQEGECIHLPIANVIHAWGRGNYTNIFLMIVNLISAFKYFWKWGFSLW